jgi:hypothetical protein
MLEVSPGSLKVRKAIFTKSLSFVQALCMLQGFEALRSENIGSYSRWIVHVAIYTAEYSTSARVESGCRLGSQELKPVAGGIQLSAD